MDFASLMSKEIAKAKGADTKKAPASADPTPEPTAAAGAPKFISRREAEEARKAAYLVEQKAREEERLARQAAKRKREDEAAEEARLREEKRQKLAEESRLRKEAKAAEEERARRKRLGLPEIPASQSSQDSAPAADSESDLDSDTSSILALDPDLKSTPRPPPCSVISKLRSLGQPATLFGETDSARLKRYRTALRPVPLPTGPIRTSLAPLPESRMKIPAPSEIPPKESKKPRRYLFRQLTSYFNMVLREWEAALAKEDNRDTLAGQAAYSAMVSSKDNMRPLFRLFEKMEIEESILEAIVEIVHAAQQRRYVDANDGYLRLSIGKAAWPIGVTMVGIHERSAREKLHNGERGHIMGSEVTRKYLQSIKRCLTFAQVRWPPEDIRQLMG